MKEEIIIEGIKLRLINPQLNFRDNVYYISNDGRIYSTMVDRFLKPQINEDGYEMIQLRAKHKKYQSMQIAKIVLATYKGMPPCNMKSPTVEHINSNRRDNSIHNLKWLEHGENASCRMNKGKGETNSRAKLTEAEVHQICKLLEETHLSCTEIGKMFHVTNGTICCIKNRRNWTYISDQYRW